MVFVSTPLTPDNAAFVVEAGRDLIRRFPFAFGIAHYLRAVVMRGDVQEALEVLRAQRGFKPAVFEAMVTELEESCNPRKDPASAYCKVTTEARTWR